MIILIILQNPKHTISTTTIVEPTGVPETIATNKPIIAARTDIIHAKNVTFRKLLKIIIEETAGNIMRADIKSVPTRFIARTITVAITAARIIFINFVFIPQV